jgi:hypothetical protein
MTAAPWWVRADAVVLATGGCAFGERILGATGLTGDSYPMAAETGAVMSGMGLNANGGAPRTVPWKVDQGDTLVANPKRPLYVQAYLTGARRVARQSR